MNKIKIILVLLALGIMSGASAQDFSADSSTFKPKGPITIYINNPLGFSSEIRGKVEYRFSQKEAILGSFSKFHGMVPGFQTYLEYRKYFKNGDRTEWLYYGKAGVGKSFPNNGKFDLFGAGIGQNITFGDAKNFSIQFSEGLKYTYVVSGDVEAVNSSGFRGLFYVTGPGAILDLNINLGWRF